MAEYLYEFYKKRALKIDDAEHRRIALIMCEHIGEENPIRREVIQARVGYSNERDVRTVFDNLVTIYKIPVLSHSGMAGYYLAATKSDADRTRAECRSRGEANFAKERAYGECEYPPDRSEPERYEQRMLIDVPKPEPAQYWRW